MISTESKFNFTVPKKLRDPFETEGDFKIYMRDLLQLRGFYGESIAFPSTKRSKKAFYISPAIEETNLHPYIQLNINKFFAKVQMEPL